MLVVRCVSVEMLESSRPDIGLVTQYWGPITDLLSKSFQKDLAWTCLSNYFNAYEGKETNILSERKEGGAEVTVTDISIKTRLSSYYYHNMDS